MNTVSKVILYLIISSSIASSLEIGSSCKTIQDEDGECIRYTDCPLILNKLKSRQISMRDVIGCNNYGVICCPIPSHIPSPSSIPKTSGDISKRSKIIFSEFFNIIKLLSHNRV